MANEIKEPRKTIPFAIVGGIVIAATIYTIVAGATLGVIGAEAMGKTDTPIFRAPVLAITGWGGWLVLISAWMTAFSEMLGDLVSTSRVGHAMGAKHELPRWLGALHERFKTPHRVLLLLAVVGIALIIWRRFSCALKNAFSRRWSLGWASPRASGFLSPYLCGASLPRRDFSSCSQEFVGF